jgi:predicted transcriptional regulator
MTQPSLKAHDVAVLAKLISYERRRPSIAQVGVDLALSSSEVHAALKRLAASRLISNDLDEGRPLLASVEEFLSGERWIEGPRS